MGACDLALKDVAFRLQFQTVSASGPANRKKRYRRALRFTSEAVPGSTTVLEVFAKMITPDPRPLRPLPFIIFGSRWLQLPLYIGLIAAQAVYVILFLKELWHLVTHAISFTEQQIMLMVLGLIDVVMISNLLVMVIVGGYETFVSRLGLRGHPDEPEWLSHVNAGVLKVKLAMAIIGISSIHLLRTFIEASNLGTPRASSTETAIMWQTIIHTIFIFSAIGIAYVDRLLQTPGSGKSQGH